MPQLWIPRKGWENENLASFLLSRIAFVASPLSIGDDAGSDFFCTLFENVENKLFPRNSFAIQIKSSHDAVNFDGKTDYLEKIELPFFVGVIDQSSLTLSIFSGEYLPIFFSHYGRPDTMTLVLDDDALTSDHYCERAGERYKLRMPHVLDLNAHEDRDSVAMKGTQLLQLCVRMHQNISAKASSEYVFRLSDRVLVFAGSSSAHTYKDNFDYRLAEAFYNLDWLYINDRIRFNMKEFTALEQCYLSLRTVRQVPLALDAAYKTIKDKLQANLSQ
jgi:hypothetical protein